MLKPLLFMKIDFQHSNQYCKKMDDYKTQQLVLEDGRTVEVPMREDGYICATKLCQSAGKRIDKWIHSPKTKLFVSIVEAKTGMSKEELILVKMGGNDKLNQGTWEIGHAPCPDHLFLLPVPSNGVGGGMDLLQGKEPCQILV